MNPRSVVTLRPARVADALVMAELSRDLIEAGLEWRYTPVRMAALIADPETIALVACDASRILGLAVMAFGAERAHLALLCVRPGSQRSGVGRQLIDWLMRSAEVAGVATIGLELRADNTGAEAFYRGLGFAVSGYLPGYYGGRIDARRMLRRLRPDTPAS